MSFFSPGSSTVHFWNGFIHSVSFLSLYGIVRLWYETNTAFHRLRSVKASWNCLQDYTWPFPSRGKLVRLRFEWSRVKKIHQSLNLQRWTPTRKLCHRRVLFRYFHIAHTYIIIPWFNSNDIEIRFVGFCPAKLYVRIPLGVISYYMWGRYQDGLRKVFGSTSVLARAWNTDRRS